MLTDWVLPAAIGIGLSAGAGFRVFVPLLVASVAARLGLLPLQESQAWISSWPAIVCFATATLVEAVAYYVPFVDNILDAVNAPLSMAAGTILAVSALPGDHEWLRWIFGILVGGGTAGAVHAGTSLIRLASTKTIAGLGNGIVATGENAASIGLSVLSLFIPLLIAALVTALLAYMLWRVTSKRSESGPRKGVI